MVYYVIYKICLVFPCSPESASVGSIQMFCLLELDLGLVFHNTELADTVIYVNLRIPHGKSRHEPLIIITAIGRIHDAAVICLYYAKILKSRAPGNNMSLITFRKLHCHPERDQFPLTLLQADLLSTAQVYPVGLSVDVTKLFYLIGKIFDLYVHNVPLTYKNDTLTDVINVAKILKL